MNVIPAVVEGNVARINGSRVPLGRAYGKPEGKVEIGVRPEYTRLSAGDGLPVKIRRIEDVGRHKIVRADFFGMEINILSAESAEVGADMNRVVFDAAHVNVYADGWRVDGEAA